VPAYRPNAVNFDNRRARFLISLFFRCADRSTPNGYLDMEAKFGTELIVEFRFAEKAANPIHVETPIP
jgi:hypothetical protein